MALHLNDLLRRSAIFVHRWLGVMLCLLFLLWFPSGIGMMYWGFPSVGPADRLDRSPTLDASAITVSPAEAAAKLDGAPVGQVRLNTFDGRPVYHFRTGRGETLIYADNGEQLIDVSREMLDRIASAWSGQAVSAATVARIEEVDQWTIQTRLPDVEPLWKYSWPDGQQLYISQATGEVVQYTTTASRLGAYLSAIPHWLYFTPLRKNGLLWSRMVIWTSGLGTVGALLGIVIGISMYSPKKRYRHGGNPTSIPYSGQKRWHMSVGLIFGVGAVTWAFSGMLSMDPFPMQQTGGGGRRGGGPDIPKSLRGGGTHLPAFAAKHPRVAVEQAGAVAVKELELTSFAGEPVYLATIAGGETRIIPVDGDLRTEFDHQRIIDVVTKAAQTSGGASIDWLDRYDRYYLDRHRERPLPVLLVRMNDPDHTRYYIDPKTARSVGTYSARNWMSRWLYHGLHSLDFPWLYDYRPLWDIVVISFMVGGTALCVTSFVLAWRVLGRKLAALTADASFDALAGSEDQPLEEDDRL
jgi:hypothetical protein